MIAERIAEVAVLIVGFRNASDIRDCLTALSDAQPEPSFDVFICENGGEAAYRQLILKLIDDQGPCVPDAPAGPQIDEPSRFTSTVRLRLRARSSRVIIGCATGNLGYAGGINAWLNQLWQVDGWKGLWILNPDTEPEPGALAALVQRAEAGNKGMVGSTILEGDHVRFRGGLHWQRLASRGIAIGLGERLDTPHDISAIEAAMDLSLIHI